MVATATEAFDTFVISAAGVVDNDTYVFVAQANEQVSPWKDGDSFPTRIISHNIKAGTWSGLRYEDSFYGGEVAGGKTAAGNRTALIVNHVSQVASFEYPDGPNLDEDDVPAEVSISGFTDLSYIGRHFYAVGGRRTLVRRLSPNRWEQLRYERGAITFRAVDGFSEDEIYVGGQRSELWHYDGKRFRQMDLGFKGGEWTDLLRISSICCAADGMVYIGGGMGELLCGRIGKGWKTLVPQRTSGIGELNALAYFKGTLYGTTDGALFYYSEEHEDWQLARFEGDVVPNHFAFLSANEERMLVAGPFGAAVWDGETWTSIYGGVSQTDMLRVQAMEKQVEALNELSDAAHKLADEQP